MNIPSKDDLTKMAMNRIKGAGGVTISKQSDPMAKQKSMNAKTKNIIETKADLRVDKNEGSKADLSYDKKEAAKGNV